MKPEYIFKIEVYDETNDQQVYTDTSYSLESLEEKTYKLEYAIENYEGKLQKEAEEAEERREDEVKERAEKLREEIGDIYEVKEKHD